MHRIDFSTLPTRDTYKFLTGVVIPRPIAWVTTLSDNGEVNAAPFSFFNVFGSNPPLVVIGTGRRPEGELKDTAHNLKVRKLAVIHLVEESFGEAMSATSTALPHGQSEIAYAGLELEPSANFEVPFIKGTRVRLQAKLIDQPTYGHNLLNVLELIRAEIAPELWDPETGYVSPEHAPIGRLAGNGYCRSSDRFDMERP
jgi:flavin reductase (DIM6/NTAB) family NADH-FMN oxidoreductase RutF